MSWDFAKGLGLHRKDIEKVPSFPHIKTAQEGALMKVLGRPRRNLKLRIGASNTTYRIKPMIVEGLSMSLNLSGPFMSQHGMDQIHSKQTLRIQGKEIPLFTSSGGREDNIFSMTEPLESAVYLADNVTVPAESAIFVPLRVPDVVSRKAGPGEVILTPHHQLEERTDLHPVLCALSKIDENGHTWIPLMNTTKEEIKVPANIRYGTAQRLSSIHEIPAINSMKKNDKDPPPLEKKDREWFIKEFKLKESPFLHDPGDLDKAVSLLQGYSDIFSVNDEYGRTDLVEHAIVTQDVPPIKCKNRPINPLLEDCLREQIDHWLKQDVIEPSHSPWSFPLLAVAKKNGKTRWVCDFRLLNKITLKDSFPIPNIGDNLSRLAKSKIFSGIDGTGAFHVVSIKESDREKTAFSTPWGLYQFKQMPFGLCNAPATYCRLVQKVLDGIPPSVALPYLDDTCIHSAGLEEHLAGLEQVLAAHRRSGLTLQPSKCQLFQDNIEYLGHNVSQRGVSIPDKYVDIVKNWPIPSNVKDVRVFLGKASYYRRFIKDFSKKTVPLTDLTTSEAEEEFHWNSAAEKAFNEIKESLLSSPILAYPRFDSSEPFIVDTDWSHDPGAIGAVLSQVQEGEERVIAYGAKKLNAAEKNYSSNKGEMLAVIFFLKHWRYYLSHKHFILRSDHEALKWIRTMEEPKGMIARWLDTLANFDFTVEFRQGKRHGNADALSRVNHAELIDSTFVSDEVAALRPLDHGEHGEDRLREEQKRDPDLSIVRKWMEEDKWPTPREAKPLGNVLRSYAALEGEIFLRDDLIVRKQENHAKVRPIRPCLPSSMQTMIGERIHEEIGHRGIVNTHDQINQRFFFPGSAKEASLIVNSCPVCQKNQPKPKEQQHTLASQQSGAPWQRISIDFVGPLPESAQGNSYVLTIKDYFSRWIEAIPTNNLTAETVARSLEREIFCRYGFPESIHSDRGTQFTSRFMAALYTELGIKHTHTPAYNPKSSVVERSHRDLGKLLRACVDESPQEWEEYLPACLLAMRTARNQSSGYSPHFLLFGRECSLPIDVIYGLPPEPERNVHEHAKLTRQRLEVAFKNARENQSKMIERVQRRYDSNPVEGLIQEGDRVWLYTPKSTARSRKLQSRWTGPWSVVKKITPVVFRVKSGPWNRSVIEIDAGIDRLRKFNVREEPLEEMENLSRQDVEIHDEQVELGDEAAAARDDLVLVGDRPDVPPVRNIRDSQSHRDENDEGPTREDVVRVNLPWRDWGQDWTMEQAPDEKPQPREDAQPVDTENQFHGWENPCFFGWGNDPATSAKTQNMTKGEMSLDTSVDANALVKRSESISRSGLSGPTGVFAPPIRKDVEMENEDAPLDLMDPDRSFGPNYQAFEISPERQNANSPPLSPIGRTGFPMLTHSTPKKKEHSRSLVQKFLLPGRRRERAAAGGRRNEEQVPASAPPEGALEHWPAGAQSESALFDSFEEMPSAGARSERAHDHFPLDFTPPGLPNEDSIFDSTFKTRREEETGEVEEEIDARRPEDDQGAEAGTDSPEDALALEFRPDPEYKDLDSQDHHQSPPEEPPRPIYPALPSPTAEESKVPDEPQLGGPEAGGPGAGQGESGQVGRTVERRRWPEERSLVRKRVDLSETSTEDNPPKSQRIGGRTLGDAHRVRRPSPEPRHRPAVSAPHRGAPSQ